MVNGDEGTTRLGDCHKETRRRGDEETRWMVIGD